MRRLSLAIPVLALLSVPASAGGDGCQGACYRQAWVPPVYAMQAERYVVRAPRTYAYVTPAEHRVVHERVLVQPATRRWSVTRDHHGHEIGCWVEVPARYAEVARTVMVRGPEVVPVAVPAEYGVRMHSVMTQPAHRAWVPLGHGQGY